MNSELEQRIRNRPGNFAQLSRFINIGGMERTIDGTSGGMEELSVRMAGWQGQKTLNEERVKGREPGQQTKCVG